MYLKTGILLDCRDNSLSVLLYMTIEQILSCRLLKSTIIAVWREGKIRVVFQRNIMSWLWVKIV